MENKERDIEKYLVKKVKALSGKAYKFVSPGNAGVPDRLVCLPAGKIFFVELKASGKKLRPLQENQKRRLTALGCKVFTADSYEQVDLILKQAGDTQ